MKCKSQIKDKAEHVVQSPDPMNTAGNHWSSPEILRQNSLWPARETKECEMNNDEMDGYTDFQLAEQLKMCLKTVMLSSLAPPGRWEWGMWLTYTCQQQCLAWRWVSVEAGRGVVKAKLPFPPEDHYPERISRTWPCNDRYSFKILSWTNT